AELLRQVKRVIQLFVGNAECAFISQKNFEAGVTPPNDVFEVAFWLIKADRKSTRLNSSHVEISYAVFCLKKKKRKNIFARRICPGTRRGRMMISNASPRDTASSPTPATPPNQRISAAPGTEALRERTRQS